MSFIGVQINKQNGNLDRVSDTGDNIFGLRFVTSILPTGITSGTAYRLLQAADAQDLGITPDFDSNNNVLLHYHVEEFFRYAPEAILFIDFVADINDDFDMFVRENDIKCLGIVHNGGNDFASITGLVPTFQNKITAMRSDEYVFLDALLLESGNGTFDTDLRTLGAENVAVTIAADPVMKELGGNIDGRAAVGSVLGMLAVRQVNENAGSVDIINKPSGKKGNRDYPLTDAGAGRFITATLSDGTSLSEVTNNDRRDLTKRGYIYAGNFAGYPGYFLNNSPTCTSLASDYAYIENNRVWNKTARVVREALIPKVRSILRKDATTGFLLTTTVKAIESIALSAVNNTLVNNQEISGFGIEINPQQLVSDTQPLKMVLQIVIDGILHEMEIDLGLVNQVTV